MQEFPQGNNRTEWWKRSDSIIKNDTPPIFYLFNTKDTCFTDQNASTNQSQSHPW